MEFFQFNTKECFQNEKGLIIACIHSFIHLFFITFRETEKHRYEKGTKIG